MPVVTEGIKEAMHYGPDTVVFPSERPGLHTKVRTGRTSLTSDLGCIRARLQQPYQHYLEQIRAGFQSMCYNWETSQSNFTTHRKKKLILAHKNTDKWFGSENTVGQHWCKKKNKKNKVTCEVSNDALACNVLLSWLWFPHTMPIQCFFCIIFSKQFSFCYSLSTVI